MKLDLESVNLFHPTVFEHYGGSLIQLKGPSQALGGRKRDEGQTSYTRQRSGELRLGSSMVMRLSNPEGPSVHFHCQQHPSP